MPAVRVQFRGQLDAGQRQGRPALPVLRARFPGCLARLEIRPGTGRSALPACTGGHVNPAGAKFCSSCGEKLETESARHLAGEGALAARGAVMPEDFGAARLAGRMKPHQERGYFDADPAAEDAATVARVLGDVE